MTPRRRLLLPALLLAHGGVAVMVVAGGGPVGAVAPPSAIALVDMPGRVVAPLQTLEPKVSEIAFSVDAPPVEISGDSAAPMAHPAVASGGGCTLSDDVQAALRDSPGVKGALGQMPKDARSVADAVLLWDGNWADEAMVGGAPALGPIQQAVKATIRAAAPDCREAPVTGPRLLFIAEGGGTRVLAFGSGVWKWSQLLDPTVADASQNKLFSTPPKQVRCGLQPL